MKHTLTIFLLLLIASLHAQNPYFPKTLNMQERAEVIDQWMEERVQTVLPELMKRTGIDMWVIIAREYNEDPVIKTMLPATWQSARRTTILVIYDPGSNQPLETMAMARYGVGKTFKKVWDKETQPDQWKALAELIQQKNPKKIGINKSKTFALADGISSTHYDQLMEALPSPFQKRVVSAENLAIGWLETRTPSEMMVYQNIVRMAHQIIAEGFSEKVIQPGVTTTDDAVWWYRDRIRELGFTAWFHPSVAIQRKDPESFEHLRAFSDRPEDQVIIPGDLLHVDFGITYLRLNTDTQQHAYVLKPGEMKAPDYLNDAFTTGNQLQDVFTANFKTGMTGNEVLAKSLSDAKEADLKPTIYTHPIGYHGHAAGPTIGLWDQQGGVPGAGDYPLFPNTAYSIELNNAIFIEEWDKEIRIMLEEDAFFDGNDVKYIDGRQTELLLIPRPLPPNK
ncbi:MAG: Xaa-Pro aminopeptidase [Flammeovirgaceae bacterium]|nr:Xaa-Pro aminopeptidase [Flammeovirgaceae bacterium]MBE62643.1 Xaa-Pro aminopeptidase [Flammeovirgaceae bacterium]MBR09740.1 Xaa-Pro aminopeptidase [Rickettsiales bacterium]MBR11445.1 Xaa-Pro aminopeptidase [Rickettsiales bacterium]HCX21135.1 Xaa-Pro aminopeptidase [Cytophagales bacterium]